MQPHEIDAIVTAGPLKLLQQQGAAWEAFYVTLETDTIAWYPLAVQQDPNTLLGSVAPVGDADLHGASLALLEGNALCLTFANGVSVSLLCASAAALRAWTQAFAQTVVSAAADLPRPSGATAGANSSDDATAPLLQLQPATGRTALSHFPLRSAAGAAAELTHSPLATSSPSSRGPPATPISAAATAQHRQPQPQLVAAPPTAATLAASSSPSLAAAAPGAAQSGRIVYPGGAAAGEVLRSMGLDVEPPPDLAGHMLRAARLPPPRSASPPGRGRAAAALLAGVNSVSSAFRRGGEAAPAPGSDTPLPDGPAIISDPGAPIIYAGWMELCGRRTMFLGGARTFQRAFCVLRAGSLCWYEGDAPSSRPLGGLDLQGISVFAPSPGWEAVPWTLELYRGGGHEADVVSPSSSVSAAAAASTTLCVPTERELGCWLGALARTAAVLSPPAAMAAAPLRLPFPIAPEHPAAVAAGVAASPTARTDAAYPGGSGTSNSPGGGKGPSFSRAEGAGPGGSRRAVDAPGSRGRSPPGSEGAGSRTPRPGHPSARTPADSLRQQLRAAAHAQGLRGSGSGARLPHSASAAGSAETTTSPRAYRDDEEEEEAAAAAAMDAANAVGQTVLAPHQRPSSVPHSVGKPAAAGGSSVMMLEGESNDGGRGGSVGRGAGTTPRSRHPATAPSISLPLQITLSAATSSLSPEGGERGSGAPGVTHNRGDPDSWGGLGSGPLTPQGPPPPPPVAAAVAAPTMPDWARTNRRAPSAATTTTTPFPAAASVALGSAAPPPAQTASVSDSSRAATASRETLSTSSASSSSSFAQQPPASAQAPPTLPFIPPPPLEAKRRKAATRTREAPPAPSPGPTGVPENGGSASLSAAAAAGAITVEPAGQAVGRSGASGSGAGDLVSAPAVMLVVSHRRLASASSTSSSSTNGAAEEFRALASPAAGTAAEASTASASPGLPGLGPVVHAASASFSLVRQQLVLPPGPAPAAGTAQGAGALTLGSPPSQRQQPTAGGGEPHSRRRAASASSESPLGTAALASARGSHSPLQLIADAMLHRSPALAAAAHSVAVIEANNDRVDAVRRMFSPLPFGQSPGLSSGSAGGVAGPQDNGSPMFGGAGTDLTLPTTATGPLPHFPARLAVLAHGDGSPSSRSPAPPPSSSSSDRAPQRQSSPGAGPQHSSSASPAPGAPGGHGALGGGSSGARHARSRSASAASSGAAGGGTSPPGSGAPFVSPLISLGAVPPLPPPWAGAPDLMAFLKSEVCGVSALVREMPRTLGDALALALSPGSGAGGAPLPPWFSPPLPAHQQQQQEGGGGGRLERALVLAASLAADSRASASSSVGVSPPAAAPTAPVPEVPHSGIPAPAPAPYDPLPSPPASASAPDRIVTPLPLPAPLVAEALDPLLRAVEALLARAGPSGPAPQLRLSPVLLEGHEGALLLRLHSRLERLLAANERVEFALREAVAAAASLPPSAPQISPTVSAAHRAALFSFYLHHVPSKATAAHVGAAWASYGPAMWPALVQKYGYGAVAPHALCRGIAIGDAARAVGAAAAAGALAHGRLVPGGMPADVGFLVAAPHLAGVGVGVAEAAVEALPTGSAAVPDTAGPPSAAVHQQQHPQRVPATQQVVPTAADPVSVASLSDVVPVTLRAAAGTTAAAAADAPAAPHSPVAPAAPHSPVAAAALAPNAPSSTAAPPSPPTVAAPPPAPVSPEVAAAEARLAHLLSLREGLRASSSVGTNALLALRAISDACAMAERTLSAAKKRGRSAAAAAASAPPPQSLEQKLLSQQQQQQPSVRQHPARRRVPPPPPLLQLQPSTEAAAGAFPLSTGPPSRPHSSSPSSRSPGSRSPPTADLLSRARSRSEVILSDARATRSRAYSTSGGAGNGGSSPPGSGSPSTAPSLAPQHPHSPDQQQQSRQGLPPSPGPPSAGAVVATLPFHSVVHSLEFQRLLAALSADADAATTAVVAAPAQPPHQSSPSPAQHQQQWQAPSPGSTEPAVAATVASPGPPSSQGSPSPLPIVRKPLPRGHRALPLGDGGSGSSGSPPQGSEPSRPPSIAQLERQGLLAQLEGAIRASLQGQGHSSDGEGGGAGAVGGSPGAVVGLSSSGGGAIGSPSGDVPGGSAATALRSPAALPQWAPPGPPGTPLQGGLALEEAGGLAEAAAAVAAASWSSDDDSSSSYDDETDDDYAEGEDGGQGAEGRSSGIGGELGEGQRGPAVPSPLGVSQPQALALPPLPPPAADVVAVIDASPAEGPQGDTEAGGSATPHPGTPLRAGAPPSPLPPPPAPPVVSGAAAASTPPPQSSSSSLQHPRSQHPTRDNNSQDAPPTPPAPQAPETGEGTVPLAAAAPESGTLGDAASSPIAVSAPASPLSPPGPPSPSSPGLLDQGTEPPASAADATASLATVDDDSSAAAGADCATSGVGEAAPEISGDDASAADAAAASEGSAPDAPLQLGMRQRAVVEDDAAAGASHDAAVTVAPAGTPFSFFFPPAPGPPPPVAPGPGGTMLAPAPGDSQAPRPSDGPNGPRDEEEGHAGASPAVELLPGAVAADGLEARGSSSSAEVDDHLSQEAEAAAEDAAPTAAIADRSPRASPAPSGPGPSPPPPHTQHAARARSTGLASPGADPPSSSPLAAPLPPLTHGASMFALLPPGPARPPPSSTSPASSTVAPVAAGAAAFTEAEAAATAAAESGVGVGPIPSQAAGGSGSPTLGPVSPLSPVGQLLSPASFEDVPLGELEVGHRVRLVEGPVGTVRYVGGTSFASGEWVGLELDDPRGTHDGTVGGVHYFTCVANAALGAKPATSASLPYAIFVRRHRVARATRRKALPAAPASPPHHQQRVFIAASPIHIGGGGAGAPGPTPVAPTGPLGSGAVAAPGVPDLPINSSAAAPGPGPQQSAAQGAVGTGAAGPPASGDAVGAAPLGDLDAWSSGDPDSGPLLDDLDAALAAEERELILLRAGQRRGSRGFGAGQGAAAAEAVGAVASADAEELQQQQEEAEEGGFGPDFSSLAEPPGTSGQLPTAEELFVDSSTYPTDRATVLLHPSPGTPNGAPGFGAPASSGEEFVLTPASPRRLLPPATVPLPSQQQGWGMSGSSTDPAPPRSEGAVPLFPAEETAAAVAGGSGGLASPPPSPPPGPVTPGAGASPSQHMASPTVPEHRRTSLGGSVGRGALHPAPQSPSSMVSPFTGPSPEGRGSPPPTLGSPPAMARRSHSSSTVGGGGGAAPFFGSPRVTPGAGANSRYGGRGARAASASPHGPSYNSSGRVPPQAAVAWNNGTSIDPLASVLFSLPAPGSPPHRPGSPLQGNALPGSASKQQLGVSGSGSYAALSSTATPAPGSPPPSSRPPPPTPVGAVGHDPAGPASPALPATLVTDPRGLIYGSQRTPSVKGYSVRKQQKPRGAGTTGRKQSPAPRSGAHGGPTPSTQLSSLQQMGDDSGHGGGSAVGQGFAELLPGAQRGTASELAATALRDLRIGGESAAGAVVGSSPLDGEATGTAGAGPNGPAPPPRKGARIVAGPLLPVPEAGGDAPRVRPATAKPRFVPRASAGGVGEGEGAVSAHSPAPSSKPRVPKAIVTTAVRAPPRQHTPAAPTAPTSDDEDDDSAPPPSRGRATLSTHRQRQAGTAGRRVQAPQRQAGEEGGDLDPVPTVRSKKPRPRDVIPAPLLLRAGASLKKKGAASAPTAAPGVLSPPAKPLGPEWNRAAARARSPAPRARSMPPHPRGSGAPGSSLVLGGGSGDSGSGGGGRGSESPSLPSPTTADADAAPLEEGGAGEEGSDSSPHPHHAATAPASRLRPPSSVRPIRRGVGRPGTSSLSPATAPSLRVSFSSPSAAALRFTAAVRSSSSRRHSGGDKNGKGAPTAPSPSPPDHPHHSDGSAAADAEPNPRGKPSNNVTQSPAPLLRSPSWRPRDLAASASFLRRQADPAASGRALLMGKKLKFGQRMTVPPGYSSAPQFGAPLQQQQQPTYALSQQQHRHGSGSGDTSDAAAAGFVAPRSHYAHPDEGDAGPFLSHTGGGLIPGHPGDAFTSNPMLQAPPPSRAARAAAALLQSPLPPPPSTVAARLSRMRSHAAAAVAAVGGSSVHHTAPPSTPATAAAAGSGVGVAAAPLLPASPAVGAPAQGQRQFGAGPAASPQQQQHLLQRATGLPYLAQERAAAAALVAAAAEVGSGSPLVVVSRTAVAEVLASHARAASALDRAEARLDGAVEARVNGAETALVAAITTSLRRPAEAARRGLAGGDAEGKEEGAPQPLRLPQLPALPNTPTLSGGESAPGDSAPGSGVASAAPTPFSGPLAMQRQEQQQQRFKTLTAAMSTLAAALQPAATAGPSPTAPGTGALDGVGPTEEGVSPAPAHQSSSGEDADALGGSFPYPQNSATLAPGRPHLRGGSGGGLSLGPYFSPLPSQPPAMSDALADLLMAVGLYHSHARVLADHGITDPHKLSVLTVSNLAALGISGEDAVILAHAREFVVRHRAAAGAAAP